MCVRERERKKKNWYEFLEPVRDVQLLAVLESCSSTSLPRGVNQQQPHRGDRSERAGGSNQRDAAAATATV